MPERYISELKVVNGQYMISLAGLANHREILEEAPINLYRQMGEKAPGSYGLLYLSDDESEFENEFRVGKLTRGNFELVKDVYLSPRIPTIENSC